MLAANDGTGDFTSFESNGWIRFPQIVSTVPIPPENQGAWSAAYVGEQRLWEDPCDEQRYTKLWGYVGLSDETVNPFTWTATVTMEGFGYCDRRPDDRMGIGYFYSGLSDDFRNLVSPVEPISDLHGGEVYYNAAVTPWFHLTVDLQAVRPGFRTNDTAVVLGLRGKLDF
jgi:porin